MDIFISYLSLIRSMLFVGNGCVLRILMNCVFRRINSNYPHWVFCVWFVCLDFHRKRKMVRQKASVHKLFPLDLVWVDARSSPYISTALFLSDSVKTNAPIRTGSFSGPLWLRTAKKVLIECERGKKRRMTQAMPSPFAYRVRWPFHIKGDGVSRTPSSLQTHSIDSTYPNLKQSQSCVVHQPLWL